MNNAAFFFNTFKKNQIQEESNSQESSQTQEGYKITKCYQTQEDTTPKEKEKREMATLEATSSHQKPF